MGKNGNTLTYFPTASSPFLPQILVQWESQAISLHSFETWSSFSHTPQLTPKQGFSQPCYQSRQIPILCYLYSFWLLPSSLFLYLKPATIPTSLHWCDSSWFSIPSLELEWEFTMPLSDLSLVVDPSQGLLFLSPFSPISESFRVYPSQHPPLSKHTYATQNEVLLQSKPDAKPALCGSIF